MSGRFAGKVVVVTGASMGVGAATARAFARKAARIKERLRKARAG